MCNIRTCEPKFWSELVIEGNSIRVSLVFFTVQKKETVYRCNT